MDRLQTSQLRRGSVWSCGGRELDRDLRTAEGVGVQSADEAFEELLGATRNGDEAAAQRVFEQFQPALLRFLRGVEPRAADDLAGEVWVAVATGLGTFEGNEAGFRSWVFTIARNRLADHRRRGARRQTAPTDADEMERAVDLDRTSADPLDTLIERLTAQEAVDELVRHLTAEQSEVILLRVLAGLDVTAVADIMGRSENWVRVTQHRALRRLSRRLGSRLAVME